MFQHTVMNYVESSAPAEQSGLVAGRAADGSPWGVMTRYSSATDSPR